MGHVVQMMVVRVLVSKLNLRVFLCLEHIGEMVFYVRILIVPFQMQQVLAVLRGYVVKKPNQNVLLEEEHIGEMMFHVRILIAVVLRYVAWQMVIA